LLDFFWKRSAHELPNGIGSTFADLLAVHVYAAHSRLRSKWDELCMRQLMNLSPADAVLFGQYDDASPLGRFICQARKLRRIGQLLARDARRGNELGRLAIAQRDGAGLVEKKDVYIARRLDGPATHRQHVVLHHSIDARDSDRAE